MSEFASISGKVAGVISFVAFLPYIWAILRGETRPNRATWLIWTIVGLMLGASYYSVGATHTLWVCLSYIIGPLIILILSIKYGQGGWTRLDKWCLFLAGISVALWLAFDSPLIALSINLFIDFLGAIPTIKKVYYDPKSEDLFAWSLTSLSGIVNLFAIESLALKIVIYPAYVVFATCSIALLIAIRRKQMMKKR